MFARLCCTEQSLWVFCPFYFCNCIAWAISHWCTRDGFLKRQDNICCTWHFSCWLDTNRGAVSKKCWIAEMFSLVTAHTTHHECRSTKHSTNIYLILAKLAWVKFISKIPISRAMLAGGGALIGEVSAISWCVRALDSCGVWLEF